MKICFFGVGGVGGYLSSLITKAFEGGNEIYFIARGKHKEAIIENGLTLKKSDGKELITVRPKKCTDKVDELPICDIIFLSVKGYDINNAAKNISRITNEKTLILPLLNGVDIYERIRKNLKSGFVFPSCVYISAFIESPGVIYQQGDTCKICLGSDPLHPDYYPHTLLQILDKSLINYEWDKNIKVAIWSKYIFIAAFGLVTAAFDKTLGEILNNSELSRLTKGIMCEINEIAEKFNIPLSSDIVETSFSKAKQFPFDTTTSFQRDVGLKGKVNEGDLFGGTIIRLGEELKLQIPNTKKVYNMILQKLY